MAHGSDALRALYGMHSTTDKKVIRRIDYARLSTVWYR